MSLVVIRCDGSPEIGLGHVSRCLALANELGDIRAGPLTFVMRDPRSVGFETVRAAGYDVVPVVAAADGDYGEWLCDLVASTSARRLIVDVGDQLSRASLDLCRRHVVVATIDDGSDRRLASDLAFYPPVPQVAEMDWTGFTGRRYAGWEWVTLRREFGESGTEGAGGAGRAGEAEKAGGAEGAGQVDVIDVLVTMGGSDPAGLTEFTIGALDLVDAPLSVRVVIGPGFTRADRVAGAIARSRHATDVSASPASMSSLMRSSRVAVSSFGVSAYELAACGVPAVHLCLTDDHMRSSSAFEREAIARTAGAVGHVTPQQVADHVSALLASPDLREDMSARARRLVDGRGAARVALAILAG